MSKRTIEISAVSRAPTEYEAATLRLRSIAADLVEQAEDAYEDRDR